MTIKIELEEDEIIRAIYELRRIATEYATREKHYDSSQCLLLSHRIEMQYRAQQKHPTRSQVRDGRQIVLLQHKVLHIDSE